MRILQLSWEYPPHVVGGLGRHVSELLPALVAEGLPISLITPQLRDGALREDNPYGFTVVRVPPPHDDDEDYLSFVADTNMAIERAAIALHHEIGRFDMIHAHDWLVAQAAIALKHAWRVPLIATIHATERGRGRGQLNGKQSQYINELEWRLTYEAWRAIVCSHFMVSQLRDTFTTPLDKIDMVPNGVHLRPSPFADEHERLLFRRRFVDDNEAMVFYVGRVVYEKGVHILLDAWPQITAAVRARLVIAGTGALLDSLKAQSDALGIHEQVRFTGYIDDSDRDRLYHIADVAVFPSLYEPFGIVVLEAFAASCPVVATATGGLIEVVHAHDTGILAEPNDPHSLAWAITQTLQHPLWAQARAARALEIVRERYTWRRIAHETATVYQRVHGEWQQNSWGKEISLRLE
jgi:glycosyltransferase involved in cell wall biosynthesis